MCRMGEILLFSEPQFSHLGQSSEAQTAPAHSGPLTREAPSSQFPEFWPSSLYGLSFACPLLLLSFCGLEGTAVGTESRRPQGRLRGGALGRGDAVFLLGDGPHGAALCRMFLQELGDSDVAASSLDLLGEATPGLQAQVGVRVCLSGPLSKQPSLCPQDPVSWLHC